MKDNYRTIKDIGRDEIIIKKSRFIGHVAPVESEEEALKFIGDIRKEFKDATHNVHAYVIGENDNIQKYNDDKEPSGTAGIPILDYIKKEKLKNVVIVVTRYYGGIKLGVGGLVRAYLKGAKGGVLSGKIVEKRLFHKVELEFDYNLQGKIENELSKFDCEIENKYYTDKVKFDIYVEKEKLDNLIDLVSNITNMNYKSVINDEEFKIVEIKE